MRDDVRLARLRWAVLAILATLSAAPHSALAQFRVCNQTLNLFNVAIGYPVEGDLFKTEGWWTLAANSCTSPIKEKLTFSYYYVYGTDIYGEPAITGSTEMCVAARQFTIADRKDCWVRGFQQVPFLEVNTKNAESWTVFIRER